MMNVEFRINGQLMGFMNIHNESTFPNAIDAEGCKCRYSYKLTTPEGSLHNTEVIHKRSNGFEKLVNLCLDDVCSQRKKEKAK